MSSAIPKTGLAARLRAWMLAQTKPWTVGQMCDVLDIPPGNARDRVRNVIPDFVGRMEIIPLGPAEKEKRRQLSYAYNRSYRRIQKGILNKKIFKAMYVSVGAFALSDIQRLAGAPARSYLDKMIGPLRKKGFVTPVGRRRCAHGAGAETLYHIADRDRFRLEVMQ